MATIKNTTERVYRLKGDKNKNHRYTEVKLYPGINAVTEQHWNDVAGNWFTVWLLEEGKIVKVAGVKADQPINEDTGSTKIASVKSMLPKDSDVKNENAAVDKAVELARENERLKMEAKGTTVDTPKVAPVNSEEPKTVVEEKTPVKEEPAKTASQRKIAEAAAAAKKKS